MLARLSAFVIWALVAAAVVFWGLRLAVSAPQAPLHTVAIGETLAQQGDLSRLLGATPVTVATAAAAPEAASRFRLVGVMAPKGPDAAQSQQGVALIAVDGKPAKAYAVGARLDGEIVLQSVRMRAASIAMAPGQPPLVLELPAAPPPSTGTLPALSFTPSVPAPEAQPGGPQPVPPPPGRPPRRELGAAAQ